MKYLILHKVRGEPAFDVAEQIQIGNEEGWIIPTSGHRAYPYAWKEVDKYTMDLLGLSLVASDNLKPEWENLPDHYQISRQEPKQALDIGSLLSDLMPKGKFKRRA